MEKTGGNFKQSAHGISWSTLSSGTQHTEHLGDVINLSLAQQSPHKVYGCFVVSLHKAHCGGSKKLITVCAKGVLKITFVNALCLLE